MKLKARVIEQKSNQILLEFVKTGAQEISTGVVRQVKAVVVPYYDVPKLKQDALVRVHVRDNAIAR